MDITIGHVIAYALDAQFQFEGKYPGPHRDIGKNIITINKILAEFRYNQPSTTKNSTDTETMHSG